MAPHQRTSAGGVHLQRAAEHWKATGKEIPDNYQEKLLSMATFCTKHNVESVPDPYYGGASGFNKVLDLLDDACTGLLEHISSRGEADTQVEMRS
jgi:protein-tyrosine-phosphatase